jgi:S-adenosylmethionine:tRNA ribosyltransferase-isomerase
LDRLSEYVYDLPDELIAQTPLQDRSASRLLLLHRDGRVEHRSFREVASLLNPGDLLVMNDTRVTAVRLMGKKLTGAAVEALLLHRISPYRYEALVKPGKRLKSGTRVDFEGGISATVDSDQGEGVKVLEFSPDPDLPGKLDSVGHVPLPPYIHARLADKERYQTVYGTVGGSAAAPTAGLHFTPQILAELKTKGVEFATVTLHVGLDTFRPVQVEDLSKHKMHGESCEVSDGAAKAINGTKGRIIAVGTTTVRTLESFAIGPKEVSSGVKDTRLFIRPGYRFQIVDGMFTNFHLPGTTMLVMISALVGRERLLNAYAQAVEAEYRFLSFGDSMLVV